MKSRSAPFSIVSATGLVTFRDSRRSWTTFKTWASRRSGCCRFIRRRSRTTATTSPTTPGIHPQFGTLEDFQAFLEAAHDRGLRVITELVLNHTSDQHPWFQRAGCAPAGSPERDFYVWSDTPEKYQDARVIFQDFEPSNWTLGPGRQGVLLAPLLLASARPQFDNPAVWAGHFSRRRFLARDGRRRPAARRRPLPLRARGDQLRKPAGNPSVLESAARARRRALSRGGCSWPRPISGPRTPSPTSARATNATWRSISRSCRDCSWRLHQEDRFPIHDIMAQTPAIPENCQWCLFLRNHDELTLEMVTDEERDYMYRAYARDRHARINLGIRHRLAPLLHNDRRRIELMLALLFSLPGTPVIYYGDEIGMGDNIYLGDRNGVRTPMQWSADRNAGFSRANPQRLYLPVIIDPEYHYETVNVEAQQANPSSLLWWIKRLITLRKSFRRRSAGDRSGCCVRTIPRSWRSSANTMMSASWSLRTCRGSCSTCCWT